MCVCVCVCACVWCGAIAQLVRESSYGVFTSGALKGASSSHSDGELWHNFLKQETNTHCFSRLRSINEYLVIDWCPKRPSAVT